MSNAISLTIPVDNEQALVAAANMLMDIAGQSFGDTPVSMFTEEEKQPVIPPVPADQQPNGGNVDPAAAFGAGQQEQAPTSDEQGYVGTVVSQQSHNGTAVVSHPPTTTGVEVDTDGLPWDARIHAGSKKQNADGRWKKKKGVSDEIKQQVETELRSVMTGAATQAPAVPQQETQQPATQAPAVPQQETQQPATQAPAVPPQEAQQPATQAPAVPPQEAPTDFNSFLRACSGLMQSGAITMPRITEILNGHGLSGMGDVGNRVDLIPTVWADIEGLANNG